MYTLMNKKRRSLRTAREEPPSYVKETDSVSTKAGDRLDRLKAAEAAGPAIKTGPFADKEAKGSSVSITVAKSGGAHPAAAEEPGFGRLPPISTDSGGMADHHQKLADYFAKVARPGQQTMPATTALSPYEKSELDEDINMKR